MSRWVLRWRYWLAPKAARPGVWRMKGGGYYIRGRLKDPRSGAVREIVMPLPHATVREAHDTLQREIRRMRTELEQRTTFAEFGRMLVERKVVRGELHSRQTEQQWRSILEHHLIPTFGDIVLQELRRSAIEAWKDGAARKIQRGEYSPVTANDWLKVLRVIVNAGVAELELPKNPITGVKSFDTSEHPAYTDEEPNALTPDEVPLFLAEMRRSFPQHFAMTALGFATGLRPSSMRPLRRKGEKPDVLWEEGVLLVRRSQTIGAEVMERTKTGRNQRIALPRELMDILRWHVAMLPPGPMRDSDLLFPSETGRFRARSLLDKPFRKVARILELEKRVTPRAMRRTFQDLARAAEVKDIVTRAVSGHATDVMQRHYSTVSAEEMRAGLGRVITMAGLAPERTANRPRV